MSEHPLLQCRNLSKSFGPLKVLDGVSLSVFPGDIFGFLGPNGAGKSTTIRIIADLIRPDEGSVSIHGFDVSQDKIMALKNTGMLIEKPAFYPHLSARRNLKMICDLFPDIPLTEIDRVLHLVDLDSAADRKVRHFSQGMKQRLGIAQALMGRPDLIVLDEPTNGLDPVSMRDIRNLMKRFRDEGHSILLSSHLLYEVERTCNRMAIINAGHVVREGKVEDLLSGSTIFRTEFVAENSELLQSFLTHHFDAESIQATATGFLVKVPQGDIPGLAEAAVKEGVRLRSIIPRSTLEDYFIETLELS